MARKAVLLSTGALLLGFGSQALAQGNPLRDAYFGETHVHTSWSLDAWLFGNRVTDPGDAYKYFKGETIKHPLGYDIKIDSPLDFAVSPIIPNMWVSLTWPRTPVHRSTSCRPRHR